MTESQTSSFRDGDDMHEQRAHSEPVYACETCLYIYAAVRNILSSQALAQSAASPQAGYWLRAELNRPRRRDDGSGAAAGGPLSPDGLAQPDYIADRARTCRIFCSYPESICRGGFAR